MNEANPQPRLPRVSLGINFRLIFLLSFVGPVLAVGVFLLVSAGYEAHVLQIEKYVLFGLYVFFSIAIARYAPTRFFLHGFLICLINFILLIAVRAVIAQIYLHEQLSVFSRLKSILFPELPSIFSFIEYQTIILGCVLGLATGFAIGATAWVLALIIRR